MAEQPKPETQTDQHGIKWFRYPGDRFWQTQDIALVKKVQRLLGDAMATPPTEAAQ